MSMSESPAAGPSNLDRRLLDLADELRGTGWPNEAAGVVAALNEIRGAYWGRDYPSDDSLIVLYDRLRQLSESAANIAELIRTCYSEPHHR
jgi:hypothetical protein